MKTLLICCFTLLVINLNAQYAPMDIPVVKNGTLLKNPWAGGFNLPQLSEVDLNNDGILDLVSYDREGAVFSAFINGGTVGAVDYEYAPAYIRRLPHEGTVNFMLFRDYNCDGIQDIFGMYYVWGQSAGIAVWQGSYDANDTIQYTLVKDQLRYNEAGKPLDSKMNVSNPDLPAIDDIDGDGDLDILVYGSSDPCFFNNVFWMRNMSIENGHNCDSLEFFLETECWGLFEESGDSSKVNLGPHQDSCYNNPWFNQKTMFRPDAIRGLHSVGQNARNGRHSGTNLTMIDYNGDGVKDLVLGEVSYKNINLVSGISINDTILITTQDHRYPRYDVPVDLYSFPATFFLDVNNDGVKDMLITPSDLSPGDAVMDSVVWYYQNTGTNTNMLFDFQQKDFLVGEMLDVGRRAFPALFDYDGDGLQDILVGGYGRCQVGGTYQYGMTLLRNTGTLLAPAFEQITTDYLGADSLELNGLYPTFGDLDGDGDQDLICGAENGRLTYFENNSTGTLATWDVPQRDYLGINVGQASAPFLVDLDRDGDLDLLVGRHFGGIHYYENTGTVNSPSFSATPTTNKLGNYEVPNISQNTMPFVYDHNGAYELYIGHQGGNLIHLGNIDFDVLGTYDTLSDNFNDFYEGKYTTITVGDIDNDNKLDYLLGTGRGGLMFMGEKDTATTTVSIEVKQKVIHLYPNPAEEELTISFLENNKKALSLTVYNSLGQVMMQKTMKGGGERYHLDLSKLPSGLMFLDIKSEDYQEVVRFVKQ